MPSDVTISDPGGRLEATFVPELGMIGRSLRQHGEELFAQRDGLDAYASRGSTFALPLLYPFAGRLSAWEFELAGRQVLLNADSGAARRDPATGLPIHGLLAASPYWRVVEVGPHSLASELDFGAADEYLREFPFPHRLRYAAAMSINTLTVSLTVSADQGVAVPVSFGFHPYLTLPGSDRREWLLELPVMRRALLNQRLTPSGQTAQVAPGELDGLLGERAFDSSFDRLRDGGPPRFVLADAHRRLTVTFTSGYPAAQIYSPTAAQFICFEPMTAPINALISGDGLRWVAPGERFEARFLLAVEAL